MTKWAYSNDDESYHGEFETPEEAIAAGIDEAVDSLGEDETEAGLSIGVVGAAEPVSTLVNDRAVNRLLDAMLDRAGELLWPEEATAQLESLPKEEFEALKRKLRATIDQWASEYDVQQEMHSIGRVYEISFPVCADDGDTLEAAWQAWHELGVDS